MNKQELKYLAPYLPYGLKCHAMGMVDDDFADKPISKVFEIVGLNTAFVEFHEAGRTVTEQFVYSDIFPLLRPLSDLTKEIEHNGERFVPVEMFEIGDEGGFNYEFDHGNIKLIQSLKSIAKYNNIHDIHYLPSIVCQLLIEWHFDVFNLIEQGLAIDINTLQPTK